MKPIVQHGFSDTGAAETIARHADEATLRRVLSPLISDLERVFGSVS